jgi:succinate dehydrogenase/fumarate reductase-like Fe-S protein
MKDDGEFRGSTKQAIQDLKERLEDVKTDVMGDIKELKDLVADSGFAFNQQIEALVKVVNDRDERNDNKFLRLEMAKSMDDQIKQHEGDIRSLKNWRIYLSGGFVALTALAVFFGDELKKLVLK